MSAKIGKLAESSRFNIHNYLEFLSRRLAPISDTANLDAQVILSEVLGINRASLLAHPEKDISSEEILILENILLRLENGEALPHVLGRWEFFGMDFFLNPNVLIPRPETEQLVEWALKWLDARPTRRMGIDIGTGSGCIAAALANQVSDLQMIATDISYNALVAARKNINKYSLGSRIHLVQADLTDPFFTASSTSLKFNLICANLPYIPTNELNQLDVSRREPWNALDGGKDGLRLIMKVIRNIAELIADESCLLLEIEASQGSAVRALAENAFPNAAIHILKDLAGFDRTAVIEVQ